MSVAFITLCTDVAYALDDLKAYAVDAATAGSGGTAGTISGAGLGNLSTGASSSTYDGAHAYAANQQRRVTTGGFAPTLSKLTVTPPWTSAPTTSDTLYVTRLFPMKGSGSPGEETSYQRFVFDALRCLVYPDIVGLPITSIDSYDLSTYQLWLDRQERLVGIREPAPVSGRRAVSASWRNPRIEQEGTGLTLRLDAPFAVGASGALLLDVLRPPWTLVDGVESSTGPTLDAETVEVDRDDVKSAALLWAYHALMSRQASSPDGADWARKYADQRDQVMALRSYDRTRQLPPAPAAREAA